MQEFSLLRNSLLMILRPCKLQASHGNQFIRALRESSSTEMANDELLNVASCGLQAFPAMVTEYAAIYQAPPPGALWEWGRSSSDNCGACNNTCPCTKWHQLGLLPAQWERVVGALSALISDQAVPEPLEESLLTPKPHPLAAGQHTHLH